MFLSSPRLSAGLACGIIAIAAAQTASAGDIDPRGIYHNAFTGPFGGTEWFQVIEIPGTDRYRTADIFSGGFNTTILPDGDIFIDGGVGGGSFSSPDDWIITPNLGGVFTFDNVRAPDTGTSFPLRLDSAAPANTLLSGAWRSNTQQLNPRTGAVIGGGFEEVTITSTGSTFRITDPGGLFFQGVFESPNEAAFRVVAPQPSDNRFRTFPGSSINFTQNMLGQAIIDDINHWHAIILLQSRTPLGSQTQLAFRFTAERIDPLPAGDLDGDREVTNDDRALLTAQLGLTDADNGYNIAGDLNLDGVIDAADVALFNEILPDCPGDLNGDLVVDTADLGGLIGAFGGPGPFGDINLDGAVDTADLGILIGAFGQPCPMP